MLTARRPGRAAFELDTAADRDGQAVFERQQRERRERQQLEELGGGGAVVAGDEAERLYRGQAAYELLARKETLSGNAYKGFSAKGPLRAPSNFRATVRWDYQPDICKDYKETGFCGFGDNCKFLHDRSDYKSGWQIDREIEQGKHAPVDVRQYEIASSDGEDGEDDKLPFACYLCRNPFTRPVVTKCGHHFCEACAIAHHRKALKCFVCGAKTDGVFKPAKVGPRRRCRRGALCTTSTHSSRHPCVRFGRTYWPRWRSKSPPPRAARTPPRRGRAATRRRSLLHSRMYIIKNKEITQTQS